MAKVTRAVHHLSEEEILKRIKRRVGFGRVQKWLAILIATIDPCPAGKIARHTGLAEQTVHNLISAYNRLGPLALEGPGKGNRWRAYLSM
jgi:predicted transcriptional regulator